MERGGINPNPIKPTDVGLRQNQLQQFISMFKITFIKMLNIVIVLLLILTNFFLVALAIFSLLTLEVKSDIIEIALVVAILVALNFTLHMNRRELNGREHLTRIRR